MVMIYGYDIYGYIRMYMTMQRLYGYIMLYTYVCMTIIRLYIHDYMTTCIYIYIYSPEGQGCLIFS